jgi:hypothetical protein
MQYMVLNFLKYFLRNKKGEPNGSPLIIKRLIY